MSSRWVPAFAGMTLITILAATAWAWTMPSYRLDGVTVSGPHANYTSMYGANNCGACHAARGSVWGLIRNYTTVNQTTFVNRSSRGWIVGFLGNVRYMDGACLSCHNSAGIGTSKMTLTSTKLLSVYNGPAPLAAHSLTTGLVNVFSGGSAVSGGTPVSSQMYQCPRCHDPHYENNTGLNYLNTTGIYK